METDAQPAADPPKDRKTYNGIEHFPMMEMGLAHYRTIDPGIARWLQLDPKAEKFYALTPYNSMGGNPVSMVDPDGDAIFAAIAIGAFVNFAVQGFSGNINSTGDAFLAMGIGGVAGALGAASAGLSTSLGVSGILPGAAYGAGAGAVTGGVSVGLNSFLNDDMSFGQGLRIGAISGGISGGGLVGILGGVTASKADQNIWTGGEKGEVFYSPVRSNYGNDQKACTIYCLEEASRSYGYEHLNFEYWTDLYGKPLGVHPNELAPLVKKSGIFSSEPLKVGPFNPDVTKIAKAFSENKRVIAGFNTSPTNAHSVLVNKVKIWPSVKYRVWFSQSSPDRIAPFSSSNFYSHFREYGYSTPKFWTFYKK